MADQLGPQQRQASIDRGQELARWNYSELTGPCHWSRGIATAPSCISPSKARSYGFRMPRMMELSQKKKAVSSLARWISCDQQTRKMEPRLLLSGSYSPGSWHFVIPFSPTGTLAKTKAFWVFHTSGSEPVSLSVMGLDFFQIKKYRSIYATNNRRILFQSPQHPSKALK